MAIYLGRILRDNELSIIDYFAEQALAEVRADTPFIHILSINLERGLTNEYLPETTTDSAIFKSGAAIVDFACQTEFGHTVAGLIAPIDSCHDIVTDKDLPNGFCEALRANDLKVIVA